MSRGYALGEILGQEERLRYLRTGMNVQFGRLETPMQERVIRMIRYFKESGQPGRIVVMLGQSVTAVAEKRVRFLFGQLWRVTGPSVVHNVFLDLDGSTCCNTAFRGWNDRRGMDMCLHCIAALIAATDVVLPD